MPRLLAAEYVYSAGTLDDSYNDYVTTTPSPTIAHATLHAPEIIQQINTAMPSNVATARSLSPAGEASAVNNPQPATDVKLPEQQIHTISSSEDDENDEYAVEENTIEEDITNISSDESGDFKGFDDFDTTPNSSGLINDASQEDLNNSVNYLKRPSQIDFNEYHENSEGVVEAIEVDEDEEIVIGDEGQIMYKSREEITPTKTPTCPYEPHTPNKRKKQENESHYNAVSPTQLKTPPDQIVEVNSDSTTNSLKQKRQQINTKFQLNLSQLQSHQKFNNPNHNKCSTESTSEFPVSSPSNPQQPRGGKYPPRPPLLKNTLPADSFERQLAMITACNPQMTLAEKIQSWDCDEELSDVDDVNMFDEEFKRLEKQKKLEMKQREKSGRLKNTEIKVYDFYSFRQMILSNMKDQKNQKYNTGGQFGGGSGGGFGAAGGKCIETSGSESSNSVIHVDDRPSTSAVAQQQLQQRRSKPQPNLETGEPKKRLVKEIPKRNQNSTTPPQTSSSDNDCFQNSNKQIGHNKLTVRQVQLHDKLLCPSSSEEAISQDVPTPGLLKSNNKCANVILRNINKKSPTQPPAPPVKTNENMTLTENPRIVTDEEIDSVFRLHRLNRERDKCNSSLVNFNESEEQPSSIIQMRLDFATENKSDSLMVKKQELFKTPIIPQKYLANSTPLAENQRSGTQSPIKNITTNEDINTEASEKLNTSPKAMGHLRNVSSPDKLEKVVDNNDVGDDLAGVYHQQHEFCNYLGLTGMSTATAMANAVAELAQCNLARRSMRVLRQQQQERRDKSAKEEKQLEALKVKQLKEIRKREKGDVTPVVETEPTALKSDEGSHSQTSEPTNSLKEPKKKTSNNSTTKSSTKSQNSFTIIKKEPEIKILCHIAAKNKEEAAKLSQECIKEITQPIRETLMRQAKLRKSIVTEKGEENENVEVKNNENVNEIYNKMQMKNVQKTECIDELAAINMETPKRNLRSPRLSTVKTPLRNTRSRSQIPNELKEMVVQSHETAPVVCKLESAVDTVSVTKSVDSKCVTPCLKVEDFEQNSDNDELSFIKPDVHLIASTPSSVIQQKIQMALEESRKSKPSIFIVQALECKKEQTKSLDNLHSAIAAIPEVQQQQQQTPGINNSIKKSLKVETKFNKTNIKQVLKTRKVKKYPTSKRRLRKRKIIVIKTIKPKQKSYASSLLNIKRELRSSPRINENVNKNSLVNKSANSKQKYVTPNKTPVSNEEKSYRTVHTETKDLEFYLDKQNSQTKTRLMAKASALLERSRMTLRGSCNTTINKSKLATQIQRSKINLIGARANMLRPRLGKVINEKRNFISTSAKLSNEPVNTTAEEQTNIPLINLLENDNVVVSSTTNTYDERPSHEPLPTASPITLTSLHNNAASYVIASSPIQTKDQFTQCSTNSGVQYLNTVPLATQTMRNPLKSEYGVVHYIYHEVDILIVIQERLVSFWKCSKLVNILSMLPTSKPATCSHNIVVPQGETTTLPKNSHVEYCCNHMRQPASSSTLMEPNTCGEWIQLGELRRLSHDHEISVPYANRICLHNSTPIYLEMRARQLPKNQRDCNLLSMYINIYYYHDEDMIAKCNSIPLDTIQSDINSVNYTTLIDSRYFIMTWPQENLLGKTRSGLCKYSLTPQLDTLASIREFKSMRHTIRYLECMSDDKLIGFGETQVTIWDHRSGDVLMNFDLEIPLGKNLGSVYFASQDIEQNNMLILHQYRIVQNGTLAELMTLACTVTHNQPTYRLLQEFTLPMPAFMNIKCSIKSGDHLVVTAENDDELWISSANPRLITFMKSTEDDSKRFYNREKSQLIELTEKTLNVNTLANHILQLAAGK